MTEIKFMDYRVGLVGRLFALLAGIAALGWYVSQGGFGEMIEKTLMSIAIMGMVMAVLSREPDEDERIDRIRLRIALMVLGGFLGTFAVIQLWITEGPEEAVSVPEYSIIALATYLIVLEIYKRVV